MLVSGFNPNLGRIMIFGIRQRFANHFENTDLVLGQFTNEVL